MEVMTPLMEGAEGEEEDVDEDEAQKSQGITWVSLLFVRTDSKHSDKKLVTESKHETQYQQSLVLFVDQNQMK